MSLKTFFLYLKTFVESVSSHMYLPVYLSVLFFLYKLTPFLANRIGHIYRYPIFIFEEC